MQSQTIVQHGNTKAPCDVTIFIANTCIVKRPLHPAIRPCTRPLFERNMKLTRQLFIRNILASYIAPQISFTSDLKDQRRFLLHMCYNVYIFWHITVNNTTYSYTCSLPVGHLKSGVNITWQRKGILFSLVRHKSLIRTIELYLLRVEIYIHFITHTVDRVQSALSTPRACHNNVHTTTSL